MASGFAGQSFDLRRTTQRFTGWHERVTPDGLDEWGSELAAVSHRRTGRNHDMVVSLRPLRSACHDGTQ